MENQTLIEAFVLLFGCLALLSFSASVLFLIRKKPWFFSARWYFVFMSLIFVIAAIPALRIGAAQMNMTNWFFAMLIPLFLAFQLYRWWNGFFLYGIREDSFREILRKIIEEKGWNASESISGLIFPETGLQLRIEGHGFLGSFHFTAKPGKEAEGMKELAGAIRTQLEGNSCRPHYFIPVFAGIMAIVVLGVVGNFLLQ